MKMINTEETTIYKTLETIFEYDREIQSEVLSNLKVDIINAAAMFIDSEDLIDCFKWDESTKGFDYWSGIYDEMWK